MIEHVFKISAQEFMDDLGDVDLRNFIMGIFVRIPDYDCETPFEESNYEDIEDLLIVYWTELLSGWDEERLVRYAKEQLEYTEIALPGNFLSSPIDREAVMDFILQNYYEGASSPDGRLDCISVDLGQLKIPMSVFASIWHEVPSTDLCAIHKTIRSWETFHWGIENEREA